MPRPANEHPVKFSRVIKGKTYWYWRYRGQEGTLGPASKPDHVASAWANVLHRVADTPTGVILSANDLLLPELFSAFLESDESPKSKLARDELLNAFGSLVGRTSKNFPGGPDYTTLEAAGLSPSMFKSWRRWLRSVRDCNGKARLSAGKINKLSLAILHCYEWGVTEGLIEKEVADSLRLVLQFDLPDEEELPAQKIFITPNSGIDNNLVSVMMPFGADFTKVFKAIQASCKSAGFKCLRADDVWNHSVVVQDVFDLIYRCRIVISDFSGKNPNVMCETGIAHSLNKTVILITQSKEDVPFDLRHYRYIDYLPNSEGLEALSSKLVRKLLLHKVTEVADSDDEALVL